MNRFKSKSLHNNKKEKELLPVNINTEDIRLELNNQIVYLKNELQNKENKYIDKFKNDMVEIINTIKNSNVFLFERLNKIETKIDDLETNMESMTNDYKQSIDDLNGRVNHFKDMLDKLILLNQCQQEHIKELNSKMKESVDKLLTKKLSNIQRIEDRDKSPFLPRVATLPPKEVEKTIEASCAITPMIAGCNIKRTVKKKK